MAGGPGCGRAERGNYDWTAVRTREHRMLRGSYRGGLFGFVTKYFKTARSFLIVFDRTTEVASVRIDP